MFHASARLSAAEALLGLGKPEDAVNRAYYAMFSAARALLASKGSSPRTHRGVGSELGRMWRGPHGLDDELMHAFRESRELRELSDYDAVATVSNEEAEDIVRSAALFVKRCRELLGV